MGREEELPETRYVGPARRGVEMLPEGEEAGGDSGRLVKFPCGTVRSSACVGERAAAGWADRRVKRISDGTSGTPDTEPKDQRSLSALPGAAGGQPRKLVVTAGDWYFL